MISNVGMTVDELKSICNDAMGAYFKGLT